MADQVEKKGTIRKLLEKEIPGVRRAKEYIDERLTKRIVEPLAKRGYEDVGAAIATIPSTAMEVLVPENVGQAALSALPVGKAMSKGARLLQKIQMKKAVIKKAQQAAEDKAIKKAFEEELAHLMKEEDELLKMERPEVDFSLDEDEIFEWATRKDDFAP